MDWDCVFPEAMTRSHIVCSTTCLPNTALIFRYLFASVRIEVNNARYCVNGHRSEKGGHILTSVLFPLFCIGFCKIYSASLVCVSLLKLFMDFVYIRDGGGFRWWFILTCFCRLRDRTESDHEWPVTMTCFRAIWSYYGFLLVCVITQENSCLAVS